MVKSVSVLVLAVLLGGCGEGEFFGRHAKSGADATDWDKVEAAGIRARQEEQAQRRAADEKQAEKEKQWREVGYPASVAKSNAEFAVRHAAEQQAAMQANVQEAHDRWAKPCEATRATRAVNISKYGDTLDRAQGLAAWQREHCEEVDDSPMVVRTYETSAGLLFQVHEKRDSGPHLVCHGRAPADPYEAMHNNPLASGVRAVDEAEALCRRREREEAEKRSASAGATP
jgi:hypothetical protein